MSPQSGVPDGGLLDAVTLRCALRSTTRGAHNTPETPWAHLRAEVVGESVPAKSDYCDFARD